MSDGFSYEHLLNWYEKVLVATMPHLSPESIRQLAAAGATRAMQYAADHPYMASVQIISLGLTPILGAGWMLKPILGVIGFGPLGPVAGTVASWYQSTFLGAYIPAGSLFAAAQRAAMGG